MVRSVPGSVGAPAVNRTMTIAPKRFFIHENYVFPESDVMLHVNRTLAKLVHLYMLNKQEKVSLVKKKYTMIDTLVHSYRWSSQNISRSEIFLGVSSSLLAGVL